MPDWVFGVKAAAMGVERKLVIGVVFGALLALLTALVYLPSLGNDFIWDDDIFLTRNELIQENDGLYRFWFTREPPDYFPLTSTMLWFEWHYFWGGKAAGYHAVNIALHALSALLLWRVLKRLAIPGAWLAALIFALHPVNVETAAWITERKNALPMFFYLASLLIYLRFESEGGKRRYTAALFLFLLGLLSKTAIVMLPAVLLGCAWWRRGEITRTDALRALPFFALALGLSIVTMVYQGSFANDAEVRGDGPFSRLATAGWALWFYLGKAALPAGLSFVYPYWTVDASAWRVYAPLLFWLIALAAMWRLRGRWGRGPLFALGYFTVALLPILGFVNIYFMRYSLVADHWQYFGIIGVIALFVGAATWRARRLRGGLRVGAFVAAGVIAAALGAMTWHQQLMYKNRISLYRATLKMNPNGRMLWNNLGTEWMRKEWPEAALSCFTRALELNPAEARARVARGNTYMKLGYPDLAYADEYKALEYDRHSSDAWLCIGNFKLSENDVDAAIEAYGNAIQAQPDDPMPYITRGGIYFARKDYERALTDLNEAIRRQPDIIAARMTRGELYARMGEPRRAVADLSQALAMDPGNARAYELRGHLYAEMGEYRRAVDDYSKALRISPDNARVYELRGQAHDSLGQYERAISDFSVLIRLKPDTAQAYFSRGTEFAKSGQYDSAFNDLSAAIALQEDFATAYQQRAMVSFMRKDYDLAWADARRCRELGAILPEGFLNSLRRASGRSE